MPDDPTPVGAIAELRAEWGLDARVVERIVAALHPPGRTVGELVRFATAPRRDVEQVLERLGPWLREDGDRFALPADGMTSWPVELFGRRTDPERDALEAALAPIAAGLPPSVWSLDHVPATPGTMADRALYLTREYALAGRTLLCVGDHDLTSVAVALAEPAVEALVVDVDQRLLAYLADVAAERDLPITTAFADLRLGLPASFAGRADLAFTDPPYTPEGVDLFAVRALAGLRRTGHERLAIAYGFSPHQLTRGFRTQAALHELRLVLEAVLPRFNRFDGAEAIGAAASLYVTRPTRWTWPVLDRAGGTDPRIYTRGTAAAESEPEPLDAGTLAAVDAAVPPAPDRLLVGAGWPGGAAGRRGTLAEYLTGALPAATRGAPAAVNLVPHFGAVLPAALLAAVDRPATAVVAPAREAGADAGPDGPSRRLLAPVLALSLRSGSPSVVSARRADPGRDDTAEVLAWLVTHPAGAVGNAWREALLRVAARHGVGLTKNQARAAVRTSGLPAGTLALRIAELPRAAVAALLAGIPGTVHSALGDPPAAVTDRAGDGDTDTLRTDIES